jgi:hypothetical protein
VAKIGYPIFLFLDFEAQELGPGRFTLHAIDPSRQ